MAQEVELDCGAHIIVDHILFTLGWTPTLDDDATHDTTVLGRDST